MDTTRATRSAERVRELARSRGASQQDLAAAIGLTQQAVSRRLNGQVEFRLNELQGIAALLEVPLEQLLAPAEAEATA